MQMSQVNTMACLYRTSNRVLNNGIKVIILICMDGTSQYHHHQEVWLQPSITVVHSTTNALVSNWSITAFCWIDYRRPWSRYWTLVQIFCLESIDEKVQGLYNCTSWHKIKAYHLSGFLFFFIPQLIQSLLINIGAQIYLHYRLHSTE